jgi:hypothetical protein
MSGKMSRIRMKSNDNFNKYTSEGNLNKDNLTKSQLERYLRKKELESQRREEEQRKPRIKRNGKIIE